MYTLNFFRKTTLLALIGILFFSCSKDDDSDSTPTEPETGYFVKAITTKGPGENLNFRISFKYDLGNKLIGQTVNEDTLAYGYNDLGQMTDYSVNGNLSYRFEYEGQMITRILEYDTDSGEMVYEMPVSFSNGTYTVDGEEICKVDAGNQLLEILGYEVVFNYSEEMGVHRHLAPIPARYLIHRKVDATFFDMTLSNRELTGWTENSRINVKMENTRNEEGLITHVVAVEESSPEEEMLTWDIEYEQRELTD